MKANDVKLDDAKREALGAFLRPGYAECSFAAHVLLVIKNKLDDAFEAGSDD